MAYKPNLLLVPCKTGTGVTVNVPDAGLWGRRFKPQPFVAANIVSPEVWGNFAFAPATIGVYYQFQWYCENQNQPVVYTLVSGALPPGLALTNLGATAQGQVDGRPTAVGTYAFTLRATGPTVTADKNFTITVGGVPVGGFI